MTVHVRAVCSKGLHLLHLGGARLCRAYDSSKLRSRSSGCGSSRGLRPDQTCTISEVLESNLGSLKDDKANVLSVLTRSKAEKKSSVVRLRC